MLLEIFAIFLKKLIKKSQQKHDVHETNIATLNHFGLLITFNEIIVNLYKKSFLTIDLAIIAIQFSNNH